MQKQKKGLHKEISSIFNGVPIPKNKDAEQQSSTATKEAPSYGPPSHLSKGTLEAPPILKPPSKAPPTETPKPNEKVADNIPPVIKIKRARPEWLEHGLQGIKDKLFAPQPGVSPTRQKAMVVLVPVLFIGMVLAFLKVLGGGPSKTTEAKTIKPSNTVVVASAGTIDWQIPPLYPATLRDPMRFGPVPTTTQNETSKIEVKGILYSDENPSAIIGTEIVHEGGIISGATVVKINKNSVEFEMNGKRWTEDVE